MAVYGYVRVSTSRQVDEGESLAVQERQIRGYAMQLGLEIDRIFMEKGVSGSVPLADRPQGKALLERLKAGDTIITAKLDRMFRSAVDALGVLEDMKARSVSLHMIDLGGDVTGNGISKLVFTILSAVAEAERDRIRERITTVKADQKSRGRYLGGKVPFGFTVGNGGDLVEVPEEQEVIAQAMHLRTKMLLPLRKVREALISKGHHISLSALHRVLQERGAVHFKH
ncbi:resolvase [Komagataeibacter xylinus]|uniref:Resolvase n=1 Tax=Komagataeibacter xylinus TaxID=28448 RepID=A0A318PHF6_KOMXY|nr:recombinase family protein [Komagataeibacter xylinus]PYD55598.1 resolvase [Komagataeibacter xylinus]GBQ70724.1 truncated transposon gamma-delta resolvase [Komagataeibacter xylinus NBRC 15237]